MNTMHNDQPPSSQKNTLPKDSVVKNYLEDGDVNNLEQSIARYKVRLEHEKDIHDREKELFSYVKTAIMLLFFFSTSLILVIVSAIVFCNASPWLISLGTVSLLIPTVLLGCFLHHIYGQDNAKNSLAEFVTKTPLKDILAGIKEIVAVWRGN